MQLSHIEYDSLNARQKENFNFQKVSAILADYGFATMRLSDDWSGADFIAIHAHDGKVLKVQLKSRLMFAKKYKGKGLHVAFPNRGKWYLYPHAKLLRRVIRERKIATTASWSSESGAYSFGTLGPALQPLLQEYQIHERSKAIEQEQTP